MDRYGAPPRPDRRRLRRSGRALPRHARARAAAGVRGRRRAHRAARRRSCDARAGRRGPGRRDRRGRGRAARRRAGPHCDPGSRQRRARGTARRCWSSEDRGAGRDALARPERSSGGPGRRPVDALPAALSEPAWVDLLAGEELAYLTTEPARAPRTAPLPDELNPKVREALARRGIGELYEHQAEAWYAVRAGGNVIVTTGTASGKTLAFNLPVLDTLAADPKSRALYLYPTKALAQDQARSLAELGVPRVRSAIYDGDTPQDQRWQIRKWANLILTNPDMLHVGVLP